MGKKKRSAAQNLVSKEDLNVQQKDVANDKPLPTAKEVHSAGGEPCNNEQVKQARKEEPGDVTKGCTSTKGKSKKSESQASHPDTVCNVETTANMSQISTCTGGSASHSDVTAVTNNESANVTSREGISSQPKGGEKTAPLKAETSVSENLVPSSPKMSTNKREENGNVPSSQSNPAKLVTVDDTTNKQKVDSEVNEQSKKDAENSSTQPKATKTKRRRKGGKEKMKSGTTSCKDEPVNLINTNSGSLPESRPKAEEVLPVESNTSHPTEKKETVKDGGTPQANETESSTRSHGKRHRRRNKLKNKDDSTQGEERLASAQKGNSSKTADFEKESKSRPLKNASGNSNSTDNSKDHRINTALRKKLLERAEEKLRKDIISANISSSEKSERYLDRLTKELQLLTSEKGKPKLDIDEGVSENQNRDALEIDDDDDFDYKMAQRIVFQSYACHVCKALNDKQGKQLKKCTQCKMISYCSKEHQMEHWPLHKELCKVMCKICKREGMRHLFEKAKDLSPENYRVYRIHYINECIKELGRDLELWEREMFYYAQVCHTCYEYDRNKLTTCGICYNVSYCKPEHLKSSHGIWCSDFKLYADITRHQAKFGMIQPTLPKYMSNEWKPLQENMQKHVSGITEDMSHADNLDYAVLTDIATCPLTALFALEQMKLAVDKIEALTIHLIGAEVHFEADTLKKWEIFILHWLPNMKHLKVVFIGPELKAERILKEMLDKANCCKECVSAGRQVQFDFQSDVLYHDYVKSERYCRPDLICALNAGLYRTTGFQGADTWPLTIKAMLSHPYAPVVVTAYTAEELPLDVRRMQEYGSLTVILPPAKNPFSSSKPSLNFVNEESVPVIFKNFYITIVQGAEAKSVGL